MTNKNNDNISSGLLLQSASSSSTATPSGTTKRIKVRLVVRRRRRKSLDTENDIEAFDNMIVERSNLGETSSLCGSCYSNHSSDNHSLDLQLLDSSTSATTTESLLESLPLEGQEGNQEKERMILDAPSTPKKKKVRRPSLGRRIMQSLSLTPSTPKQNKQTLTPRRGSMNSTSYTKGTCSIPATSAPRRRGSLTHSTLGGGGSTTTQPKTPTRSFKMKRQSSSLQESMQQSFSNLIGNMSFSSLQGTSSNSTNNSKRSPFGKEFVQYAESTSSTDLSLDEELSHELFDFDTGAVGMEEADMLLRHIDSEIAQHDCHKTRLARACEKDWELAMARREAGNVLGQAITARRLNTRKIEMHKHEQVLNFLNTLRVVVETEIRQATLLAQFLNEQGEDEPMWLVMPTTLDGLREELDFMLADWDTIQVDAIMDQEVPLNKDDLFNDCNM